VRSTSFVKWLFPVATLLLFGARAWAQIQEGPLEITGEYQYVIDSNDGHLNPNNVGLMARPGNPQFNLMEQCAHLRITAPSTTTGASRRAVSSTASNDQKGLEKASKEAAR
jgi:hypothetical protein